MPNLLTILMRCLLTQVLATTYAHRFELWIRCPVRVCIDQRQAVRGSLSHRLMCDRTSARNSIGVDGLRRANGETGEYGRFAMRELVQGENRAQ